MTDDLLRVRGLNVQAGAFRLRDISFSLAAEEYLTVVGPTGCGKTVLLDSLAGLRRVQGGSILYLGREMVRLPPEKRHLGYSCQDGLLYPFASVKENIWFGAKARGLAGDPAVQKRMTELVERLGLTHLVDRRPAFLSGGERQRVSLARAILTGPRLLLLDEPLSALDPRTRLEIRKLLRDLHQSGGMGFIHVTHDFAEALALGSSMAIMQAGQIVQKGPAMEVFLRPATRFAAEFLCGENLVPGTVWQSEGQSWFAVREGPVLGPLPESVPIGPAWGLIRAGQLHLEPAGASLLPVNSWAAVIADIVVNGTHADVFCRGGGRWQISISLSDWRGFGLTPGAAVTLSVHPEHLHVIPE